MEWKSFRQCGEWGTGWMGSVWRNRTYRLQMGTMLLVGVVLAAFCFYRDVAAGFTCSILLAGLLTIFGLFTRSRYRQIAQLAAQLERIAGGNYHLDITAYSEGELSILSSEILKITTTLSHQAASLQKDKVFLADTLADISHQLKTPLTSLSMLADLLESPNLPEEKRLEFLRGVRTSLDRIQWLIAALLKLSQLDAGAVGMQRKQVALNEVLESAIEPLRISSELKQQKLTVTLEENIQLETDCRWLVEAVGNLLKNCVEHTGNGGQIEIRCQQNALYIQIEISDNGPGISSTDLPYIFERFYRGDNASTDSVGIGLALSKSIVQNLGGVLTAENRRSGGAKFTIKLYRQSPK